MRTKGHAQRSQRRRGAGHGFTLIELLVACALMAVLALLSWRGLDSILQTRERLVMASDELRSLSLSFSQMDEDLLRSWPVNMLKLNEPQLRVEIAGDNNAQSLYLIREVNRTGFPTRVQRVVYQVRDRQLARGFGEYGRATLTPGGGGSGAGGDGGGAVGGSAVGGGAVQAMVWQPILGGVRSITIRGWVDGRGWLDAVALATVAKAAATANATAAGGAARGAASIAAQVAAQAAAQAAARQLTVGGIEVVLERMDGQRFLRVFSVKD